MRILISNDDGIHAPGIQALAAAVRDLGEVTVVAPDRQRSASSHGISLYSRLYVNRPAFDVEGVSAYSVTGTPVDCVKWAISHLGQTEKFDLMISGINEGPNLATDVLYSGTLAAAGEAALQKVPAIAFSLTGTPFLYEPAAKTARAIVDNFTDFPFEPDTFLNVNIPKENIESAGWQITSLGARTYRDDFHRGVDDNGQTYYRYAGEAITEAGGADTDVIAVEGGNVSITPLLYRFTNHEMIGTLTTWLAKPRTGGNINGR